MRVEISQIRDTALRQSAISQADPIAPGTPSTVL